MKNHGDDGYTAENVQPLVSHLRLPGAGSGNSIKVQRHPETASTNSPEPSSLSTEDVPWRESGRATFADPIALPAQRARIPQHHRSRPSVAVSKHRQCKRSGLRRMVTQQQGSCSNVLPPRSSPTESSKQVAFQNIAQSLQSHQRPSPTRTKLRFSQTTKFLNHWF